jgi:hypothetical protein
MSAPKRNVTISVKGVPFVVEILERSYVKPNQEPRRWGIRVAGSKHELDELLDKGVIAEIDRRIKGGAFDEAVDGVPFDVPTGGVA